MKKGSWIGVAALIWLSGGCCDHPGLFQKVHESMVTVQSFYDPLIRQDLNNNGTAKQAVVAADTTLLLASHLQEQWCPNPDKAAQVELLAQEAKKLAQEAGVTQPEASAGQISMKAAE
jgi:hypothetical protein